MTSAVERRSGGAGERRAYTGRTRRVHYDSCIYIRSKNIRALCRRAPPGISSENNILMYIRPLFLRLSPRPSPRSPSSLPFACVSVSRAYSLPVAPPSAPTYTSSRHRCHTRSSFRSLLFLFLSPLLLLLSRTVSVAR